MSKAAPLQRYGDGVYRNVSASGTVSGSLGRFDSVVSGGSTTTGPAAKAYVSTPLIFASGTNTVVFQTEAFDIPDPGMYDPGTGEFTIPAAQDGIYDVKGKVAVTEDGDGDTEHGVLAVFVNGLLVNEGVPTNTPQASATFTVYSIVVTDLLLAAGDVVTFRFAHTNAGDLTIVDSGGEASYASLHFVRSTEP